LKSNKNIQREDVPSEPQWQQDDQQHNEWDKFVPILKFGKGKMAESLISISACFMIS
jgi:hypothetical protein